MKRIFTLLVALVTFSAVFAQHNSPYNTPRQDNWNNQADNRNYNNGGYYDDRPDHGVVVTNNNGRYQADDYRYHDNNRRAEIDRINRDYDRRINDYRNNRRLSRYDRDRYIQMAQRERNNKLKAFGGGVLLGGVLGVLIGSNL